MQNQGQTLVLLLFQGLPTPLFGMYIETTYFGG